jgi:large conductance mechanosensitive channel
MDIPGFYDEFKRFIGRGNVIDLAVAVVMGAASKAMIDSLVGDIISPIIGVFLGGVNFKGLSITLGHAHIMYGAFIQAMINFLMIAVIVFLIVKNFAKLQSKLLGTGAAEPKPIPEDVKLLTEIRDLLKR